MQAFVMFKLAILVFTSKTSSVNAWLTPCDSSGIVDCSLLAADQLKPESIFGQTGFVIANCTYLYCPQVIVQNSTAHFVNVTFKFSNSTSTGGALYVYQGTVNLTNCNFIGASTTGDAGALGLSEATAFLTSCVFEGCKSGGRGGAIYSWSATATLNSVNFIDNYSGSNGGAVAWQGAAFTWVNGLCQNNVANNWGGCYYHEHQTDQPFLLLNLVIKGSQGTMGAVMLLNNGVKGTMRNLTVSNTTASGQGGCIYLYESGKIDIYDSVFDGCSSPTRAGFAYIQSNCIVRLIRTTISNSYAAQQAGAIMIAERSELQIINSTLITGNANVAGLLYVDGPSTTVTCSNGSVLTNGNAVVGGGAVLVAPSADSFLNVSDCKIINNRAPNGAGILVQTTGRVLLGPGSEVSENVATEKGGGIGLQGSSSSLIMAENSRVIGNSANGCGGGFFMSDWKPNITILEGAWLLDNLAPEGSEGCIHSQTTSYFGSLGRVIDSTYVRGTIWVESAMTAMALRDLGAFRKLPGLQPAGKATQLVVTLSEEAANFTDVADYNITVGVRKTLPNFTVFARDVFGNTCPVVMSSPVIVQLTVINSNASIVGESAKAILNTVTRNVVLPGLYLNADPGSYAIEVGAVPGTIDHIDWAFPYPVVHLTVSLCDSSTSLFIKEAGRCFPIKPIGFLVSAVCATFGTVFVLVSGFVVLQLQRYRQVKVVKANSVTFLSLACTGSCLCLLSLTIEYAGSSVSCIVAPCFDNLGFTVVFAAILLKTYRIKEIFSANDLGVGKRLSDRNLLIYFGLACIGSAVFVAASTAVAPPFPQQPLVYNSFVSVDQCTQTPFLYADVAARLLVQLVACWVAFSIRNVHADFNESRFILFATYNWAIFGAMVDLLARFVVVDPVISFVLHSVAVIVPNVLTVVLLGGIKVFQCMFLPQLADSDGGRRVQHGLNPRAPMAARNRQSVVQSIAADHQSVPSPAISNRRLTTQSIRHELVQVI